jgi:hypothetical protein
MEAFESFVALTMEAEGLVVSEAVKFKVPVEVIKPNRTENQSHGYEVDLVGANTTRIVLATVKSFFGSNGVYADHVSGHTTSTWRKAYALLNDDRVTDAVIKGVKERYGYTEHQIEFRLYAGNFAAPKSGKHEKAVREWAATKILGSGPVKVYNVVEVATEARKVAEVKQYRDNAALVAIKVLEAAHMLTPLTSATLPAS